MRIEPRSSLDAFLRIAAPGNCERRPCEGQWRSQEGKPVLHCDVAGCLLKLPQGDERDDSG